MDESILYDAGLTNSQAMAYIALVKNNPCTPPRLATLINESRTNTYKILEQLEEIGLVGRDDSQKKLRFWANNPTALADRAKKRRLEMEAKEQRLQASLPKLLNSFFTYSQQPGVRFYQGKKGIKEIYEDQLRTGEPITMIRSRADMDFFGGFKEIAQIRTIFNESPIARHMFTPDAPEVRIDWKSNDARRGNTRTWLKTKDYTASVEWAVYGNKLAMISFGEEAMGTIIESPQIAEAFRQLMQLLDEGLKRRPDYDTLPRKARLKLAQ